jgi:TonB family protein
MLHGLAFLIAAASCSRDPAVLKLADPNVPKSYYQQLEGTRVASVAVTLDASGKVTDAHIYQSTGDATLDNAAVDAAKRSTYAAGQTDCKPSGGTFAVEFRFEGQKPGAVGTDCPHEARVVNVVVVKPSYWPSMTGPVQVGIAITVDPNGELVDARIAKSSNTMVLDQAAIASARASSYEPKTIAVPVRRQAGAGQTTSGAFVCKAVSGRYFFKVTYDPNH